MKDTMELLSDMVQAIAAIDSYSVPTYEDFLADEKTQDAIMYNLIIIGEAANRIPPDFQEKHPEIP